MSGDLCRCGLPKAECRRWRVTPSFVEDLAACDARAVARFEAFLREHGSVALAAIEFTACPDLPEQYAAKAALSALLRDYGIGGENG